ncbi:MAG: TetR/AcrR family transcriptional regulator [Vagococcus sp.]|uniref:TetR/AcrR family transcriptional regulator n=1 Tax=Vagococcus sp. TaxID=1933889 RepID=UPI002FCB5ED7
MSNIKISNKKRVIEVAALLFFQEGYTYTSMDEVVKKSGVSKSNVYYHFSSKEELLLAVIDYWIDVYQSNIEEVMKQTDLSLSERMLTFLEGLASSIEQRNYQGSCPFITFIMQSPNDDLDVKEKINHFFDDLTSICEHLIQQGIETKEFRKDINAKETAQLFINNLEGALFLAEVKRDSSIITSTAKDFLKLLI